jgi:hypothetical protein
MEQNRRLTSISPTQRFGGVPIISRSVAGQMRGSLLPYPTDASLRHERRRNARDSDVTYRRPTPGQRLSLRVLVLPSRSGCDALSKPGELAASIQHLGIGVRRDSTQPQSERMIA